VGARVLLEKVLVRRRGADGQLVPTQAGLQYFKYARDEYSVTVGSFRHSANGTTLVDHPPTALSDENFVSEYLSKPEEKLAYTRLSTEAERLNSLKTAAYDYIDTLQTILVAEIEYKVLFHDSTPIL